jgi:hypothetical protein
MKRSPIISGIIVISSPIYERIHIIPNDTHINDKNNVPIMPPIMALLSGFLVEISKSPK